MLVFFVCFVSGFETKLQVAQAGLKLAIHTDVDDLELLMLLFPHPTCWHHRSL